LIFILQFNTLHAVVLNTLSMKKHNIAAALLTALLLCASGCDEGLGPINESAGFSGVITLKNWPSTRDSVLNLRIIALTSPPTPPSGMDPFAYLLTEWASGRACFFPSGFTGKGLVDSLNAARYGIDTTIHYLCTEEGSNLRTGLYEYVAIAQQYGPNVMAQWKVAGVYSIRQDTLVPEPVRVLLHRIAQNVDITVDFRNPPPQPW
jgi:hypothetical protein